ncbi:subtilisin-like protease SBT3.9 isoform X1 [Lycium barbarum]|uniref:subtilisin-like protease SBT3.9 isoform X1 n=1 Tax=Lycium barbarum TaxID=112863 RepID=UPI00293F705E|nr:subtilisin-like protease SBT3.9 isoform X1 [Lycium barbarum]
MLGYLLPFTISHRKERTKKMNNPTSSLVFLFFLLIFTCLCEITAKADEADAKIYIVYLGHKPHDDHELITDSHHDILGQVVGSKEEAKKRMIYSYRHGFSGFAAKLTNSQAKQIGELPEVVRIIQNSRYKTHTSRSWDFLGLSKNDPNNLLNKTNQGDGVIIGILDSGIWGDSEAFNDKGLGPIPSRWKGNCKSEGNFNATKHCNKKIIGARWYIKGMMEEKELNQTMVEELYDLSPLDDDGHGTHVAYTAAGSYVNDVQYYGLNMGTVRGGAPLARLAIYKVCWKDNKNTYCGSADILAGIDDAIKDGVDILSASIGDDGVFSEVNFFENLLGIGSFHAVSHGISFIAAGGNTGPESSTISNTSPWVINVAASNDDREIVTPITLGNNKTILAAQGIFKGKEQAFAPLVIFENITNYNEVKSIANEVKGKVLMLFFQNQIDIIFSLLTLKTTGVLALIVSTPPLNQNIDYNQTHGVPIPFFSVDLEQGNQIFDYFQQCKSNKQDPMIKLGQSEVFEGKKIFLKVPKFSSRGPNSFTPEILKPDVAAPGVSVLAAVPPYKGDNGFQLLSGTSMAAPHVSGIVALLKAAHPNWSPAAIKSALVTTAWNEDTYRYEIYSEGTGDKLADPFDFGGGICNPNGATDPGLVYDMEKNDYLNYLCSLGYTNDKVHNATTLLSDTKNSTAAGIICPSEVPSRLDLNLPSISIPNLKNSVIVRRTVTNVGNVNSVYKLVVKPPRNTAIKVSPHVLKFNSKTNKISFEVKITSNHEGRSKFNFGSLSWIDGKHFVRIPIAVRK